VFQLKYAIHHVFVADQTGKPERAGLVAGFILVVPTSMSLQTFGKGALRVAKNYTKLLRCASQSSRGHLQRSLGPLWHPDERDRADGAFPFHVNPRDCPPTNHGDLETTLSKSTHSTTPAISAM